MRVILRIIVVIMTIAMIVLPLYSKEQREQDHILALGIDYNINRGEDSYIPILYYNYLHCFASTPYYIEAGLENSVTAFATFAAETDRFHSGFSVVFEYLIFAGSNYYIDGNSLDHLMINGNDIGLKVFFEYIWIKNLTSRVTYHPKYYFYRIYSENINKGLWIEPPNPHLEHEMIAQFQYKGLKEKNFSTLKHGILARVRYSLAYRQGYGSFYDMQFKKDIFPTIVKSKIDMTHKIYGDLGAYYLFKHDFNLQADISIGYQYRVDRNNVEQMGTWFADHGIMPGYHNYEFGHDRYYIGRISLGLPLPFWSTQVKPGYNLLFMPRDNRVIGFANYPKKFYTSFSLEVFTLINNMMPIWVKYAYGIDALRKQSFFSKVHRGNHELTLYFGIAF